MTNFKVIVATFSNLARFCYYMVFRKNTRIFLFEIDVSFLDTSKFHKEPSPSKYFFFNRESSYSMQFTETSFRKQFINKPKIIEGTKNHVTNLIPPPAPAHRSKSVPSFDK